MDEPQRILDIGCEWVDGEMRGAGNGGIVRWGEGESLESDLLQASLKDDKTRTIW